MHTSVGICVYMCIHSYIPGKIQSRHQHTTCSQSQITIEAPRPGTYIVRISGTRMLAAPQNYAIVVTGAARCAPDVRDARASACVLGCSGHGQCLSGRCACEANHVGHGCEVRLPQVGNKGGQATLRIRANGWAYLSWVMQANQRFEVSVTNKGESDVSLFAANGGPPTMSSHIWGSEKPLKKDKTDTFSKELAGVGRYARSQTHTDTDTVLWRAHVPCLPSQSLGTAKLNHRPLSLVYSRLCLFAQHQQYATHARA